MLTLKQEKQNLKPQNHLYFINEKTIQIFNLYLIAEFLDDLRKIGYMPIRNDKHEVNYVVR